MATPDKTNHNEVDETSMTALFTSRDDANHAYEKLVDEKFSEDEVSLIMSEKTRDRHYKGDEVETEKGTKAAEGAGIGAGLGGTAGGIAGGIAAAAGTVAFPGIGIVLAGPLAAALAGAGAGGAAGTLLGGLAGLGISEERVKRYKEGLEEGGILVGVHPRTEAEADYAEDVFRKYNGEEIHRPNELSTASDRSTGTDRTTGKDRTTVKNRTTSKEQTTDRTRATDRDSTIGNSGNSGSAGSTGTTGTTGKI